MTQMDDKKFILDIQDLTIHYVVESGTVHAVENLNLSLGYGENLGFVGETGAGKTTAALGIMRLVPDPPGKVIGGKIIFEGEDLLSKTESQMRAIRGGKISMIFQDPMTSLNPVITVDKQIAEMVLLHNDVTEQQALERAVEMLEMVGIKKERARDFPHQFSGGMKQRVVIAIALACNPALLIADEPTTALDVTIQAQVLELMKELRRKINTSLIMITHDLGIVAEMCDKVAIMYAGKVVEYASTEALFNRPAHPYTEGLFNSIPDLTEDEDELKVIKGLMPDPTDIPSGCSFHPRCPYAVETCSQEVPEMVEIEPGHFVACPVWGKKLLKDSAATEVK
ncbi:peptide/nickel transport system ATP-binding protein [Dethiosulfovibrio salsuginis]|uniref:Peptide/nickel transport system ATP-binding protein n=2 Tax=Dethiosulfovibrio salsuginis TaxID=561720 RepID=A0A1X7IL38_9BACT|nr:ABC transporter ATP-binding protein [Dethiosulfovibrio salsuginis]SMG15255.1 peptide/nickel transport system ATP-binding protein [Dethiosulfovibrio salsuginis]